MKALQEMQEDLREVILLRALLQRKEALLCYHLSCKFDRVQLLTRKEKLRDLDTHTNSRREGHGTKENSGELITKEYQLQVTIKELRQ